MATKRKFKELKGIRNNKKRSFTIFDFRYRAIFFLYFVGDSLSIKFETDSTKDREMLCTHIYYVEYYYTFTKCSNWTKRKTLLSMIFNWACCLFITSIISLSLCRKCRTKKRESKKIYRAVVYNVYVHCIGFFFVSDMLKFVKLSLLGYIQRKLTCILLLLVLINLAFVVLC